MRNSTRRLNPLLIKAAMLTSTPRQKPAKAAPQIIRGLLTEGAGHFRLKALSVAMFAAPLVAMALGADAQAKSVDPVEISVPVGGGTPRVVIPPAAVLEAQNALAKTTAKQAMGARVVSLPYFENETTPIPIRLGMFSTLKFPAEDKILQVAISTPEAVQVQVNEGANLVMIKLVQPMTVAATVVTEGRVYYMRVEPASGEWYQGVSWQVDSGGFGSSALGGGIYNAKRLADTEFGGAPAGKTPSDLFTGEPNFDYTVKGEGKFKPVAVWDNGRFTWVQFANNVQELPALFALGPNGPEIVNYTVHNNSTQLLANRLMDSFILRLGSQEITVTAGSHGRPVPVRGNK